MMEEAVLGVSNNKPKPFKIHVTGNSFLHPGNIIMNSPATHQCTKMYTEVVLALKLITNVYRNDASFKHCWSQGNCTLAHQQDGQLGKGSTSSRDHCLARY
jgi:hypothetical protein